MGEGVIEQEIFLGGGRNIKPRSADEVRGVLVDYVEVRFHGVFHTSTFASHWISCLETVDDVHRDGAGDVDQLDLGFPGEEPAIHAPGLVLRRLLYVHMHVAPAGSDQGLVEAVLVIRGQHDDATLLRGGPVQGVEQAREGDTASPAALGRGGALHEDGVHVLEQEHGPRRRRPQQLCQVVVVHVLVGKVHQTHVQAQLTCQHLCEGRLATTGRAIQQVPTPVRNACIVVPICRFRRKEVAHVFDNIVRKILVQHDGVSVATILAYRLRPHGHPHVFHVNVDPSFAVIFQHRAQGRRHKALQWLGVCGPKHPQHDRLRIFLVLRVLGTELWLLHVLRNPNLVSQPFVVFPDEGVGEGLQVRLVVERGRLRLTAEPMGHHLLERWLGPRLCRHQKSACLNLTTCANVVNHVIVVLVRIVKCHGNLAMLLEKLVEASIGHAEQLPAKSANGAHHRQRNSEI
mmetsp:Transcript_132382/g.423640  ORF Transcript_132382/g.423640 Transcript_132382/m.423640 type:complete len:459 (+) Transcript_132382:2146-3522(+)